MNDIDDLDVKIAKLQEEKARRLASAEKARREKEAEEARILIGSTPTKKKPRLDDADLNFEPRRAPKDKMRSKDYLSTKDYLPKPIVLAQPIKSKMSATLASLRRTTSSSDQPVIVKEPRSSSFTQKPLPQTTQNAQAGPSASHWSDEELEVGRRERDDDMTLLHDLMPGPREFGKDPEGSDKWSTLEPNTRIRLSKRDLPHDQLQDHLSGRYFLPPSLLYSVIRLSKDGATYDVPVDGDWVTIAVVAERGEIKVSGAKNAFSDDEDDSHPDNDGVKQGDKPMSKEQLAQKKWQKRRGPRKYINFKLCALPSRNKAMKGEVAGDAMLQLLLFESDAKVHGTEGDKVMYRGGSGGAYEKWCNLNVGSVIALLNPRVLRPLKSGGDAPHPLTLPLALNPTSEDGITLIGHSKDLGCCSATLKDGKRCRNWVDIRINEVCEFHLHAAIQRGRSGRAELASSNSISPFGTQRGGPSKGAKFGLLPKSNGPKGADAGATYVVSGRTVSTGKPGISILGDEQIAEKFGRGRTSRQKRKLEAEETERALNALLEKDSGFSGGSTGGKYLAVLRKQTSSLEQKSDSLEEGEKKRVFDADAIKKIGFDPTARKVDRTDDEKKKRLAAISSLRDLSDRPLKLARPRDLGRSSVRAPEDPRPLTNDDDVMIDLD